MNAQLEQLLTKLESDREKLFERIGSLPADKFNHSELGKWSIHQILAHLITAEKMSLQYLNKKFLGIQEAKNSGMVEEIKMIVLKISQRLPFKFKAPKKVVEFTPVYPNLETLNKEWSLLRQELRFFLEKIKDDQVNKKIYRHVFAGMLNSKQALIFFREHFIHHLPQINRLIR
jgi:DinB superfamily